MELKKAVIIGGTPDTAVACSIEPTTIDMSSFPDLPTPELRLYDILDDIDTAFDMFKPKEEGFEKYVWNKIQEAKRLYICDGYVVKRKHRSE